MDEERKEVAEAYQDYSKENLTKYSEKEWFFSEKEAESTSKHIGNAITNYDEYLEQGKYDNTLSTLNDYADSIKEKVQEETGDGAAAEFAKEMVVNALKPLEYLVRGAQLQCNCGSHTRKLELRRCHGLHLAEIPMMHEKDCKVDEHIHTFGICNNPVRIQEAELNGEDKKIYKTQENADKNIKGYVCIPKILSSGDEVEAVELDSGLSYWAKKNIANPFKRLINTDKKVEMAKASTNPSWHDAKEDAYVIRKKLITTDSWLQCAYGGVIAPISSGQENAKGVK